MPDVWRRLFSRNGGFRHYESPKKWLGRGKPKTLSEIELVIGVVRLAYGGARTSTDSPIGRRVFQKMNLKGRQFGRFP